MSSWKNSQQPGGFPNTSKGMLQTFILQIQDDGVKMGCSFCSDLRLHIFQQYNLLWLKEKQLQIYLNNLRSITAVLVETLIELAQVTHIIS